MRLAPLALGAALLVLPACLRVGLRRELAYERPPQPALESLGLLEDFAHAGSTRAVQLDEALAGLGAPRYVWALGDEGSDGAALVWAWSGRRRVSLNLSLPLNDRSSSSFEFQDGRSDLEALVLFFDRGWELERWQFGRLDALLPGSDQTYF